MRQLFAVIQSGEAVSGTVDVKQIAGIRAIHCPGLTSGDLLVQGALDSSSGSFARFRETRQPGSGDLRHAVGVGSCFLADPLGRVVPAPYLRLESAVAQTDTRTFTILVRP